jgi:uncharacterized coiled-coil DUF342 family protein
MSENLTKDDLVLLMESYRNMIQLHSTILDRTNKTTEMLDKVVAKQDMLLTKQASLCNKLGKCVEKLNEAGTKIDNTADKIDNAGKEIRQKIDTHNLSSVKDHGRITNKIYVGWIGMGSIIIALISLIFIIKPV